MSSSPLLVLVTGANQGLGNQVVRQLVADGGKFHVIAAARSQAKADEAVKKILADTGADSSLLESIVIDLASDESIEAAAEQVSKKHGKLDILVNNAAISYSPNKSATRRQQYNECYDTNVTGTAMVTDAFIPLLQKSTAPAPGRRIVNVSSGLGSLELTKTGQVPILQEYAPYSITKAALNMQSLYTSKKVEADKITVLMVCPGFCATNLNNYAGTETPEKGGEYIVKAIKKGDFETANGKFLGTSMEYYPW